MTSIRDFIDARTHIGFSQREVSAISGVSESTIRRAELGESNVSIVVFNQLMYAVGAERAGFQPICDYSAMVAARFVLGDATVQLSDAAREWITRWRKMGSAADDASGFRTILRTAGYAARILDRPHKETYRGPLLPTQIFSRLRELQQSDNLDWAVTGADGLPMIYVSDPRLALERLNDSGGGSNRRSRFWEGVTLLDMSPVVNARVRGRVLAGGDKVRSMGEIQTVIDMYSAGQIDAADRRANSIHARSFADWEGLGSGLVRRAHETGEQA
ncbi:MULTISPECIES: helix-turn-helix domain-containing protein [Rhodococcus]|uniref:Transcriptional regulator n=1 Tax=Rhodococcus qingshengii JCM 15477 TaxID=1303681 RepID=A0AB38R6T3_RHOSG|nr:MULTISPECIES: helix-turn-helix domain-containing protein [Rhodococcus]MCD2131418.1 transcriptional regulator [Rhodococcus qingshengii]UPU40835.1 transcriptional regulator [Rhodococcus qingshengii JCM 15477]